MDKDSTVSNLSETLKLQQAEVEQQQADIEAQQTFIEDQQQYRADLYQQQTEAADRDRAHHRDANRQERERGEQRLAEKALRQPSQASTQGVSQGHSVGFKDPLEHEPANTEGMVWGSSKDSELRCDPEPSKEKVELSPLRQRIAEQSQTQPDAKNHVQSHVQSAERSR